MADENNSAGAPSFLNKPPQPETVVVDKTMLEEILKEVQNLRNLPDEVARLTKENMMLTEVADVGRVQRWQNKNNPQGLVRTARAWVFEEKLVKATFTVRNSAFTDTLGRVHTDQVLNVIFEDGSEREVTFDEFHKLHTTVEGDIIKRSTDDAKGQTFYTLKFKDGKEFTVNYLFTN